MANLLANVAPALIISFKFYASLQFYPLYAFNFRHHSPLWINAYLNANKCHQRNRATRHTQDYGIASSIFLTMSYFGYGQKGAIIQSQRCWMLCSQAANAYRPFTCNLIAACVLWERRAVQLRGRGGWKTVGCGFISFSN